MAGRGGVTVQVYIPHKELKQLLALAGNKTLSELLQYIIRDFISQRDRDTITELMVMGRYKVWNKLVEIRAVNFDTYREFLAICEYCLQQYKQEQANKQDIY